VACDTGLPLLTTALPVFPGIRRRCSDRSAHRAQSGIAAAGRLQSLAPHLAAGGGERFDARSSGLGGLELGIAALGI
jgi:hypothetical protein